MYLRKMASYDGQATDVLPPGEVSGRNFDVVANGIWYLTVHEAEWKSCQVL